MLDQSLKWRAKRRRTFFIPPPLPLETRIRGFGDEFFYSSNATILKFWYLITFRQTFVTFTLEIQNEKYDFS